MDKWEGVTVPKLTIKQHDTKTPDVYELASRSKAMGHDKYYAWDMYVKWTGLKPEVNADEFYEIFESASGDWREETTEVDFKPNHYDRLCKQKVQISQDETGVYHLIWQDGTTGTNPPMIPPEHGRFVPFDLSDANYEPKEPK